MSVAGHLPTTSRNLPEDLYGHFDIRPTPDGGKQYSLPHTLAETVRSRASQPSILMCVAATALATPFIWPETDKGAPLAMTWLYSGIVFFLLHGLVVIGISGDALLSGKRKVTRITIREDGLIWNDSRFFASDDIWRISYGTVTAPETPEETLIPRFAVSVGTQVIVLADNIDIMAGTLFAQRFAQDIRRYWHRHN